MMKFSNSVESGTKLPETEIDWKNAIDKYIYGIRKFYLKEKLNEMHVYLKYGVLRPSPGFRKHNFFHWSFIKQKVRNVNEIDTELYKGRLLNNQRLRKAIDNDLSEFLKSNPNADERELEDRKRKIDVDLNMSFDALRTHFEKLGLFTLVLPTHFMMRKMFDGVYFDNKFIEYVRNHDYRNGPLIFLPTHRSYIDFLLISYLLVIRDGQPPFIGAADNMNNIFFVSELFHRSGAFYIKRTGQKFPKIYRTLLNEYMKLILENEINIEFFIEASRSRTGQILHPKYGMLKYVFEAYFEKRIPNATLIPINVTYENLIEADSYITEHRGGQKVAEDTMRMIKSLSLISKNFGRIILNSGEPVSLKKYINDTLSDNTNTNNFRDSQSFEKSIENLGNQIADSMQNLSVFMITHLVCCVLLMRHHYQLVKDLERYVELLKVQIKKRSGIIFEIEEEGFNFEEAIKCFRNRLSIRGKTFNEKRVCINKTPYIENCLAIRYYANSLNYLFFIEALIYFSMTNHRRFEMKMDLAELFLRVQKLQKLFRKEIFLLKWIDTPQELLDFILEKMKMLRVINPTEMEMPEPSSLMIEVIPDLDEDDHLLVELYSTIIPPLYYSFMILFICIYKGEEGPSSSQFLKVVQKLAEKVHGMGLLANAGFVSMLSIKSAYEYLLKEGFVTETPTLQGKKIVPKFVVNDLKSFKVMLKDLRDDFNWKPNYMLVKRIFTSETRGGAEIPVAKL